MLLPTQLLSFVGAHAPTVFLGCHLLSVIFQAYLVASWLPEKSSCTKILQSACGPVAIVLNRIEQHTMHDIYIYLITRVSMQYRELLHEWAWYFHEP